MYSQTFDQIVTKHIKTEGGYVNHPDDPGQETKYGISKRFNPDIDVVNLTVDGAKAIYYECYWKPFRLDEIKHFVVVEELFDEIAGPQGPKTTIKIAQGALILLGKDVVLDGVIGDETINALNTYSYPEDLVKLLNLLQFVHFLIGTAGIPELIELIRPRLPQLKSFIRGWVKHRIKL